MKRAQLSMSFLAGALWLVASPVPAAEAADDRLHAIAHLFADADIVAGPSLVDCTLSGGTETSCFSITVRPSPKDRTPGPWCPSHASDGPDASGIWINRGHTLDADGAFMTLLPDIYRDDAWQIIELDTGNIRVTRTKEACAAAARPDVDPQYNNYCVQCLPEYVEPGLTTTYTLPLDPVPLRSLFGTSSEERAGPGGVGVALDGVRLDGPAPLDAILDAHTIAPFDDCGGHVNLHAGYHYHAVTDCTGAPVMAVGAEAETIGVAMDGHLILSRSLADGSKPEDLDQCNGHLKDGTYHYHAGDPGANQILPCLVAERGCAAQDANATCDATQPARRP